MDAYFRKIYPRFWLAVRGLKIEEKAMAIYILTGPQSNRIGIFNFSIGMAIEDLETLPQTFRKGFKRVCLHMGWRYDETARVLYIPTWWKWNPPDNPNVLKGNLKDLALVAKSPLISDFCRNTEHLENNLAETFTQTLPQTTPKTEAEAEAEAEAEDVSVLRTSSTDKPVDHAHGLQKLASVWNDLAPPALSRVNLPFSRANGKLKKLKAIAKTHDLEWWRNLFSMLTERPFLLGVNDRGWRATFDFVLERADEIMDGKYSGTKTEGKMAERMVGPKTWLEMRRAKREQQ